VKKALQDNRAVYFAATGGVGALISHHIMSAKPIAFPDLGPEAVLELTVKEFPTIVALDAHGGDIFEAGRKKYAIP
jgi:fumarate hydratase subunit beta